MARLTKVKQPIFAGGTTDLDEEIAVFGSMKSSPVYTTDLATLMASTAYTEGWSDSVVVGYGPFLEEMNGVQYGFSYQLAYNQQEGIPEWDGATTYYVGSLAKLVTASGCQVYSSKIDNNIGNLVSDTNSWKLCWDSTKDYQALITGAASSVVSSNLTANRAVIADNSGKLAVSNVTSAELGFLSGVTSAIQTQLNGKTGITTGSVNRTINGHTYTQYYFRFSNGVQICVGSTETTGANNTAMNFAQSFTSVWGSSITMHVAGNFGYTAYIHSVTETGISVHRYNNDSGTWCSYIVIGYKA